MTFHEAYAAFRKAHPIRPEELAVLAEVSVSAVERWDRVSKDATDKAGRNPSHYNRVRISRVAENLGVDTDVLAALKTDVASVARP